MANTINKSFQPKSKEVRYLNKDFSSFRENLINFLSIIIQTLTPTLTTLHLVCFSLIWRLTSVTFYHTTPTTLSKKVFFTIQRKERTSLLWLNIWVIQRPPKEQPEPSTFIKFVLLQQIVMEIMFLITTML